MTTKQIILSIQYYALKAYLDAATRRLKRIKNPERLRRIRSAIPELQTAMAALALEYQKESGEVQTAGEIIPPPPPPPPPPPDDDF